MIDPAQIPQEARDGERWPHQRIYLEPRDCADPSTGPLWAEHDIGSDNENGLPVAWEPYVKEAELTTLRAEMEGLQAAMDVVRASGLLIGSTTLHDRVRAVVHAALTQEKQVTAIDLIRAETLEAAARVADDADEHSCGDEATMARCIAAAIRALKAAP